MNSQTVIESLESRIAPAVFIAAAGGGIVNVFADFNGDDTFEAQSDSFQPFVNYRGPINVAMGDFDGDGNDELVTAQAGLRNAQVKVWDLGGGGRVGAQLESLAPFAGTLSKGVSVAAGDLNGDGRDELIVGAGPGGAPTVEIYSDVDADGRVLDDVADTATVFTATFKGGVKVAAGNTNNTGGEEVIAGMWRAGGQVNVFTDADGDRQITDDAGSGPLESLTPFGAAFKAGVNVASGLIEGAGGGGAEIVVGSGRGLPRVLIFADANNSGTVGDDAIFDTLLPAGAGLRNGAAVAAGDTDNSGAFVEVVVGPGAGAGAHVKIFDDSGDAAALLSDNELDFEFDAFARLAGGVSLAVGKVRTGTFGSMSFPQSIPEFGGGPLNASIFVPAGAGVIVDLDVTINLAHTFTGDLEVMLVHVPTGNTVTLFTDIGGTDEALIIRLNDEAGTDIGTADSPTDGAISGTFNPEGAALLSAFDGVDAGGEWRLVLADDTASGADTGTLFDWSLRFSY